MGKIKRLLLTTLEDPYNLSSWSGIPFSVRNSLEKLVNISVVGNVKPKRNPGDILLRALLGGKPPKYPLWMTSCALNNFARRVEQAIAVYKPDAVLSISSQCLVRLSNPGIPLYMFSDAPWQSWKETYGEDNTLRCLSKRFARLEAESSHSWAGVIFGSAWAAIEAKRLYRIEQDRIHTVQLGANLTPSISKAALWDKVLARPIDKLSLLYVGKDWVRKGGPLAVSIARRIHEMGIEVTLHIVGCIPKLDYTLPYLVLHGSLLQNDGTQRFLMERLFADCHFLLVPTTAECYGIVFAEAQSFSLPPISTNVNSLPSVVIDDVTGLLLDRLAGPEEYVTRILKVFKDRPRYLHMAALARERYEAVLNWETFAANTLRLMENPQQSTVTPRNNSDASVPELTLRSCLSHFN